VGAFILLLRVFVLATLVKVQNLPDYGPRNCAGAYALLDFVLHLLWGALLQAFWGALVQGLLSAAIMFAIGYAFFWLLRRFSDTILGWILILVVGTPIMVLGPGIVLVFFPD